MKVPHVNKRALAFIVILIALAGYFYMYPPKIYPIPSFPEAGLYGKARGYTLYILFMTHPKTGERYPLRDYDTIFTNDLIVASLTFEKTHDVPIRIVSWREVTEGNETKRVKVDERTYTVTVKNKAFTEQTLQLPTHDDKVEMEVWVDDAKLFTVYHWTHPLMIRMPRRFTFGSYMSDVLGYVAATAAVIFVMLGVARWTVQRSRVVPRGNYWLGLALLGYVMFFIYMIIDTLIYMFGITSALWSLIPIALISYLAGLFMVSIPLKTLICIKTAKADEDNEPRIDFELYNYVEREGKKYLPIGVLDFLLGRQPAELVITDQKWLWKTGNPNVQGVYYKRVTPKENTLIVEAGGIHEKNKMEVLTEIQKIENLSDYIEELEAENRELNAELVVQVFKERRKAYSDILNRLYRREEPKVERGEGEKAESD
jgi:hypothetical protein